MNGEAKMVLRGEPFEEGEKRGWGEGPWVHIDSIDEVIGGE